MIVFLVAVWVPILVPAVQEASGPSGASALQQLFGQLLDDPVFAQQVLRVFVVFKKLVEQLLAGGYKSSFLVRW